MAKTASGGDTQQMTSGSDQILFWGCFIALITTAFGFISRMFLINTWGAEFGLDSAQMGRLAGIGIWPFAFSIIIISLAIDYIGYKTAMIIAFLGHIIWAVMGVSAYFASQGGNTDAAFNLLYWGSLILAIGNGGVEAFINPVVATMFPREKTKWLNILHAGWPGGLVLAGIIVIFMGDMAWWIKVGIIAIPACVYLLMLLPCRFPVNERVESGVSYREMLAEFGILGALIVGFLVALQLMDFFSNGSTIQLANWQQILFWGIGLTIILSFGIYTRAVGRPLMFVLVLIMIPLATTEIGTDGWITGIMEGVFEMSTEEVAAAGDNPLVINDKAYRLHPGWVLVYTSAIMMVLRFFAGPIVHSLSPLGLLAISSVLAIAGLYTLSSSTGTVLFIAATLYGVGKTFFWPTMLGVVSEQTPKGGALTLNAISGIGMLACGTLGFPYIGSLQEQCQIQAVAKSEVAQEVPGLVDNGTLTAVKDKTIYEIIRYSTVDDEKLNANLEAFDESRRETSATEIKKIRDKSNQGALANMALFPTIMLVGYICLIGYFRATGGYRAQQLDGSG
ncbi:MAG: MFS transporter [Pirellulaceae bacterium]|nr:MFS transporter [Pirellulaceae bacterium]